MLRFEADTMREALDKVKADLGQDAVILQTKQTTRPGLLGLSPKERVQVWAALQEDAAEAPRSGGADELAELRKELRALRHEIALLTGGERAGAWPSAEETGGAPIREVARRTATCGGLRLGEPPLVVALVGPTGSGKTTTLVKLAAEFARGQGKRVAAITTDTLRVGAVEALSSYCRLLGVPLEKVSAATEMAEAIHRHRACDLILIDTPGASQRNEVQLRQTRDLLQAACPNEVHLVLSASASAAALQETIERFADLSTDHLILTKCDEAPDLAPVLGAFAGDPTGGAVAGMGRPISYLTTGQAIPGDLWAADDAALERLMARGATGEPRAISGGEVA
jgi:flagellar biosynthesis protein FlhF